MKTHRGKIQPRVIAAHGCVEVWFFRGNYYQAFTFADGVVQLRASTKEGHVLSQIPLNSHNTHDRALAIEWLNVNA